jgi:putative transposase
MSGLITGIQLSTNRTTSHDCSGCGTRVKKTLSVRTHICPQCHLVIDRDENAALNILVKGLNQVAASLAFWEQKATTRGDIALKTYPGALGNENAWGENNLCLNLETGSSKLTR